MGKRNELGTAQDTDMVNKKAPRRYASVLFSFCELIERISSTSSLRSCSSRGSWYSSSSSNSAGNTSLTVFPFGSRIV